MVPGTRCAGSCYLERQPRELRYGERWVGSEPKFLDHELQLSGVLCRVPDAAFQELVQRLFAV